MSQGQLIIIGAGLGGLTAALALQRAGWRVRVYEQAGTLGEAGAGISLSTGAGAGLATLGIGPALLAASLPVPDIAFLHYRTGALLAGTLHAAAPPDSGFATSRHMHRADLHAILLAAVLAADPDCVITGHRLERFAEHPGGITAYFSNGATASADALIAADGVRSAARRQISGDDAPQFAGQIAFRCLIPADVAAPFMQAGRAAVYIGARRVFNRYAIRGGGLINVIGIAQCADWLQEGWSTPANPAEFAAMFADFYADVPGIIRCAPPASLIKWGLFTRAPLPRWHEGRALLIGDAAHAMLPFLGLGAAMAIEDGLVLPRILAAHANFAAAFTAFTAARMDRVELVRRESERQGQLIQADSPSLSSAPSQRAALFDYDPLAETS